MMTVAKPVSMPESEDTFSMPSSHSLDSIEVIFDDPNLVADAGLIQPATLAQHLGLRQLFGPQMLRLCGTRTMGTSRG